MRYTIGLLLLILMAGCASPPTAQEIESADIGPYPGDYEVLIKAFYAVSLKDPDSAMYRNFVAPKRYAIGDRINGATISWLSCVSVNARNSFGGYTGFQTDAFLIQHEKIIKYIPEAMWYGRSIC